MKCKSLVEKKPYMCYSHTPMRLKFGFGNAKLNSSIATFSLPAGHTCPFAKDCLSKADRITGKVTDGKDCIFRCFDVNQECVFTALRKVRWNNYDMIRDAGDSKSISKLIQKSLPTGISTIRIHVSGDYFNEQYFVAWLNVALNYQDIVFYCYTKAIPFLIKYMDYIPCNFRLVASKGGTADHLIEKHNLKYAEVVFSVDEANKKGLEIDHDDSHAIMPETGSFALLLHGAQPKGTLAGEAWKIIKKTVGGYSDKRKRESVQKPIEHFISVKKGKIVFI